MADIYVPIDSSPVKGIIPSGEEIIYSTLCQGKMTSGITGYRMSTDKWITHVLITKNGFAFTRPMIGNPQEVTYLDWGEVRGIYGKRIEIMPGYYFTLERDSNVEPKDDFKQRKKEFNTKIKPIINDRKKEWEENFPKKKERRQEILKRSVGISEAFRN
ncbi:MAG: hypothetical protein ACW98A_13650 [Candidatus Hodarchaeales archaeon]